MSLYKILLVASASPCFQQVLIGRATLQPVIDSKSGAAVPTVPPAVRSNDNSALLGVTGVIDFGDCLYTSLINELAVLATYCMLLDLQVGLTVRAIALFV